MLRKGGVWVAGWVTFPDVDSARAAFALGPVNYRCLACGKVHVSGTNRGKKCLSQLAQLCGWQLPPVPVPPAPKNLDLPYRFVAVALETFVGAWGAARPARELPEYLLALDPRADVRGALEECLKGLTDRARAAADRAWEAYSLLWPWLDALAEHRPPCVVVAVQRNTTLPAPLWAAGTVWLRPSVPNPVLAPSGLLAVRPRYYSHQRLNPHQMVWLGYGQRGFGVVGAWLEWRDQDDRRLPSVRGYTVLRQEYSGLPELAEVVVPNSSTEAASAVLAETVSRLACVIDSPPVWGVRDAQTGWAVTKPPGYLGVEGDWLPAPVPGRVKLFTARAEAVAEAGGAEWRIEELVVARA